MEYPTNFWSVRFNKLLIFFNFLDPQFSWKMWAYKKNCNLKTGLVAESYLSWAWTRYLFDRYTMDSTSIQNFTLTKRKPNTGQHSNDREKSENQILLLIIIKKSITF